MPMRFMSGSLFATLVALPLGTHPMDDGAFDGRGIDAATGTPLAGALIAATWMRSEDLAHCAPMCWHAQTAATNFEGRFHIDS